MRFEDKAGEEEIFVHAQKDRNEKIKNNHTERIDNNWVQSVGGHKAIEVERNHSETIQGNMTLHIGPSGVGRVLSSRFRKLVEGISEIAIKLPIPGINQVGKGIYSLFAEQVISEATSGVKAQFIGITKTVNVGCALVEQAGSSIQLVSGSQMSIDAGGAVSILSNGEIQIRCGKSEIRMTVDGFIRTSGDTLFLNLENGIEMVGGQQISLKSPNIKLN